MVGCGKEESRCKEGKKLMVKGRLDLNDIILFEYCGIKQKGKIVDINVDDFEILLLNNKKRVWINRKHLWDLKVVELKDGDNGQKERRKK